MGRWTVGWWAHEKRFVRVALWQKQHRGGFAEHCDEYVEVQTVICHPLLILYATVYLKEINAKRGKVPGGVILILLSRQGHGQHA
jgi:hypothetical protein